jgi:hypothetical protein
MFQKEKLSHEQKIVLAQRSPQHPKNKVGFWQRVSKVTITSMADPYFIGILNKLNISAKMVFKE